MNWLGFFAVIALGAIIVSFVTDLEMTECRSGFAYAMLRFCKPAIPATDDFPIRMHVWWQL